MPRPAFSLPVVLFTVSLGGALAVGGAFVSRQLATSAKTLTRAEPLGAAAQEWAIHTLLAWDSAAAGIPLGGTVHRLSTELDAARINVWSTRVDSSVYWIVVEATGKVKPLMRQRLGFIGLDSAGHLALVPTRAWSELP